MVSSSVKMRWIAVVVAAVVLAAGGVLAYRYFATGEAPGQATASGNAVEVMPDRPTDVQVDPRWSIHIPAGGVASASMLFLTPAPAAAGPAGGTPLAGALLTLSSGQPTSPWTFSWHQDQPLAADQVLYLLDDTGDGRAYEASAGSLDNAVAAAAARIAALSPDRRSGTVTVDHLSFKEWLIDASGTITSAVGTFFGQRASGPTCRGRRPDWLPDAVFLDDKNAPMRVCVGADPVNKEIAAVKVVNNRGGGLLVTAPAIPTWVRQSVVAKEAESWMPNLLIHLAENLGVPASEAART